MQVHGQVPTPHIPRHNAVAILQLKRERRQSFHPSTLATPMLTLSVQIYQEVALPDVSFSIANRECRQDHESFFPPLLRVSG